MLFVAGVSLLLSHVTADGEDAKEKRLRSGLRHNLLSPAVAYAIETNDIQMLEMFGNRNWDFSMDLSVPDGAQHTIWEGRPPLWYAIFLRSAKSVEWLLKFGKVSVDDVSDQGSRPADLLIYKERTKAEQALLSEIIDAVKKDRDGGEPNAIREFFRHISDLRNRSKSPILVSINKIPAQEDWLQKLMPYAEVKPGVVPAADFSRSYLDISWKKDENGRFYCGYNYRYGLSGHGLNGKIFSRYGFWYLRVDNSWES